MSNGLTDVIVAAATVPAGGVRAIVRITGDSLQDVLDHLLECEQEGFDGQGRHPRVIPARLHAQGLGRSWGRVPLDVLFWPGPLGPMGAPLAELQLPGSPLLVDAVVSEACRLGGRLARGGEFSLRSFLAGRLDLLQAEAVLAVVDARTPAELSIALDRMAGGVGHALEDVRQRLLDLLADVEAAIDFADEATPDAVPNPDVWSHLDKRIAEVHATLAQLCKVLAARNAGSFDVPRVVLVGEPNIGKSSLFNCLVQKSVALVADEVGTTRDWLSCQIEDPETGAMYTLVDLAGIGIQDGSSAGTPASLADAYARQELARADVVVVCHDGSSADTSSSDEITILFHELHQPRIQVLTRADLMSDRDVPDDMVVTSSHRGTGIDELRRKISGVITGIMSDHSPATLRMSVGVEEAQKAIESVRQTIKMGHKKKGIIDEAVVAGLLHESLDGINAVTGRIIENDLLDRIFSRHCIGK
ncbi:MAG: GTPase [Pirellulales bacterium]